MMTLPTHFSLVDPMGAATRAPLNPNFHFHAVFPVGQGNRLAPLPLRLVARSLYGKSWIHQCSGNVLVA